MPSKSNNKSKTTKGCVGLVYGGTLKASNIHIFKHEDSELESFAKDLSQYYGTKFDIKYVPTEDYDDLYEKVLETLDQEKRVSNTPMFNVTISDASKILKELAEAKACKSFTLDKKKKDKDSDEKDDKDEKPKKKSDKKKSKSDSDAEADSDAESGKDSDNEKDDDSENESEDEKPKKKSDKKSKKVKDESDEEDEEDDKDKKLKKKGKSDEKKSKSKSK
jgi:hypothetical protein